MTAPELATYLSTTEKHASRLLYDRVLPVVKVGRRLRVWSTDVDAWIAAQTRPAARRERNR